MTMTTTKTNRLVAEYRKSVKAERSLDVLKEEISQGVCSLSPAEFSDYARLTMEIDAAADAAADAGQPAFAQLVNAAGTSR
jgi:hypothetical protein